MNVVRKDVNVSRRNREQILRGFCHSLELVKHHRPAFGAELTIAPGALAVDGVVIHRVLSKLEFPGGATSAHEAERRQASIAKMLGNNQAFTSPRNEDTRMARLRLAHWFRGFRRSYRFVAPTGASARPFGGEEDIAVKLSDIENWEVSPSCFDYAFKIVWHNHAIKKLVREQWNATFSDMSHVFNVMLREQYDGDGYRIFRAKFKMLVRFNSGIRVTTVPKNNTEDRVIGCVPLWDMICQLSMMTDIRDQLRKVLGYDVNSRADLHKTLIRHKVATIDLSSASDLLSLDVVRSVWPPRVFKMLMETRNSVFVIDDEYVPIEMFAPMGCGTTFDVMTFTLLALLRFDRSASVFGDDIIVKTEHAERAIEVLIAHGLRINREKSFTSGAFRESCGGMYHDDVGNIVSYDFRYPTDITGWYVIMNKLRLILEAGQVSFELEGILLNTYQALVGTFTPRCFSGTEVSLRSDSITGFPAMVENEHTRALEGWWHRPCPGYTGHVKKAESSARVVPPHIGYAMLLYRGDVKPVTRKKVISHTTFDSFAHCAIRTVDTAPYSIID